MCAYFSIKGYSHLCPMYGCLTGLGCHSLTTPITQLGSKSLLCSHLNLLFIDRKGIKNQNDLWHGIKNLKRELRTITSGPKYKKNKTWSPQLEDKIRGVTNHIYWAAKNSGNNAEVFKSQLDNILPHYCNDHHNCSTSARCKTDIEKGLMYEPSKIVTNCATAKKLLLGKIQGSKIYKKYDNFFCG